MSQEMLELKSGDAVARFIKEEQGWTPDWVYQNGKPLLRFKDAQWMSIGQSYKPTHADKVDQKGNRAVFTGSQQVHGTMVRWSVAIEAVEDGWFDITSEIKPDMEISLVEALTSYEIPELYDGSENASTIIGGNPATVWEADNRLTPPVWDNPAWVYSREEAARVTYDSRLPVLLHKVIKPDGSDSIYTTICADFDTCDYKDLYSTPTRTVREGVRDYWDLKRDKVRGYKFICGAVNWMSSYLKDPHIYVGKEGIRQRVRVKVSGTMPRGAVANWLMEAWEQSYAIHNDGKPLPMLEHYQPVNQLYQQAGDWLQKSAAFPGTTGMCDAEMGFVDYVKDQRPIADWCYGMGWRQYFSRDVLNMLHYRAILMNRPQETQAICKVEEHMVNLGWKKVWTKPVQVASIAQHLKSIGVDSPVTRAADELEVDVRESLKEWMDDDNNMIGNIIARIYGWRGLLTTERYAEWGDLFARMHDDVENRYWEFGYAARDKAFLSGGQSSASCFMQAADLEALAYVASGDETHARYYRQFMNMAIGWCFHTYNGSEVPDLDFRGMSHATLSGRDQQADIPPMENAWLLKALSWLDVIPETFHERAWLDCLWLNRQAGLSQFPGPRKFVRLLGPNYKVVVIPAERVGSHQVLCESVPWMAYENPYDQTLVATYQSLTGLRADMAYGGRLIDAGEEVLAFVPRAARLDAGEFTSRKGLVYNPTQEAKTIHAKLWHAKGEVEKSLMLEPRQLVWVEHDFS